MPDDYVAYAAIRWHADGVIGTGDEMVVTWKFGNGSYFYRPSLGQLCKMRLVTDIGITHLLAALHGGRALLRSDAKKSLSYMNWRVRVLCTVAVSSRIRLLALVVMLAVQANSSIAENTTARSLAAKVYKSYPDKLILDTFQRHVDTLSSECSDCTKVEVYHEAARVTDLHIYGRVKCLEWYYENSAPGVQLRETYLIECYDSFAKTYLTAWALLRDYIKISQDESLLCMAQSRLPEDEIEFPVNTFLIKHFKSDIFSNRYNFGQMTKCLRSIN